jgi:hypothetical protein
MKLRNQPYAPKWEREGKKERKKERKKKRNSELSLCYNVKNIGN